MTRKPKQPKGPAEASKKPVRAKSSAKALRKPAGGRKAKPANGTAPEDNAAPEPDMGSEGGASVFEQDPTDYSGRRKRGRPTEYQPGYVRIARSMCALGATDDELGEALDVEVVTIRVWARKYQDFHDAMKVGKGEFDEPIIRSLAQRAKGYKQKAVKVFMPAGAQAPVYAEYWEEIPADVGAAKLWLCNRRPEDWRDRKELTGADGTPLIPVLEVMHTDGRSQSSA